MYTAILTIHIIVAIAMIGLILVQHGKGADAGASFGSGGAGTVFGGAGNANFLTRTTAVLTAIFFITSLTLAVNAKKQAASNYTLDTSSVTTPAPSNTAPATPATTTPVPNTTTGTSAN